jgi:hypothetical protein
MRELVADPRNEKEANSRRLAEGAGVTLKGLPGAAGAERRVLAPGGP